MTEAVYHERSFSRLRVYKPLEERVGIGNVFQKAGCVAELGEGEAGQYLVCEGGYYALGGFSVRFIVVTNVFGELDRPLVYCCSADVLWTKWIWLIL